MEKKKELILHTCCGPCASACIERVMAEEPDRKITLFFSNSNINTEQEYEKRLACVQTLANFHHLELIRDPYDHQAWLNFVSALPDFASFPEKGARCGVCFTFSLTRTALLAEKRNGNFATTLTVSPHKNSRLIFSIGEKWSHFEPWDFKKKDGFKRSLLLSEEFGFYRQNYCGCEFSLR